MSIMVTDTFQRVAANLGASWTNYLNGFSANNAAVPTSNSASAYNVAAYTGISFTSDQESTIVYSTITGGSQGPCVRIQGTAGSSVSYYVAAIITVGVQLFKVIGASNTTTGTGTQLGSTYLTPVSNGTSVTLSIVGSTLSVYVGTLDVIQANDSTLTGGAPGIHEYLQDGSIASFSAISFAVAAGSKDNFVIDGDSIAMGYNVATPWNSSLTLISGPWNISDLGVPNRTLATCIINASTSIDILYTPGIRNILFIWVGVNDFFFLSSSAATVYSELQTYVAARKAVGWTVIVSLICSNDSVDSTVQTFNGLLGADSSFANGILSLPITLTGLGAYSNLTYFLADGVHPNQNSNTNIIAPNVSSIVNSFIPSPPPNFVNSNIELHLPGSSGPIFSPIASATNVINYSGQSASHNSPGNNAATGNVPTSSIQEPDNLNGSNSVATPNEGSGIVLGITTENNRVQNTVKGRYDKFTVLNNPA